jgi:hypothetical protein
MANNKSFVVLIFVLCLNLISTNIYAANLGGWTLGNPVAQGASAVVNATKTAVINGANVIKNSTAKITPPASSVAKVLARGAAGYALSVAVEQLLGSVDWVLDPANNAIKYKNKTDNTIPPNAQVYYRVVTPSSTLYFSSEMQARNHIESSASSKGYTAVTIPPILPSSPSNGTMKIYSYTDTNKNNYTYFYQYLISTTYDPSIVDEEEKSIPLSTVAAQVINNAQQGDTRAQVATVAAAQDIINEAETDNTKARPIVNQLEANAETATDETATGEAAPKADPVTGEQAPPLDLSLEFPKFCTWAPTICEAAQVVLTFPNTLTEWWETGRTKAEEWALSISEAWTAAKEWATKENESEDTEVDIEELDLEAESVDINLVSGCPAPVVFIDSDFYGQPFKIEFSFDGFCSILSDWVRPILISLGAFIAALILGGVKVNE